MGFVARSRRKMWFGTEEYATWIPTPNSGADSSPQAWNETGTFLGGDGYAIGSRNSHKQYVYEWPSSSTREDAQLMKSFYEGAYGRGKLYFVEPLIYDTNVLPAKWANPAITCGFEGPSLVPGVDPVELTRADVVGGFFDLVGVQEPLTGALYNLTDVPGASATFTPVYENLFTNPRLKGDGTWAPVYENLFTNPRLKGDGTWAEVRRNHIKYPMLSQSLDGWTPSSLATRELVPGIGVKVIMNGSLSGATHAIQVAPTGNYASVAAGDIVRSLATVSVPSDAPRAIPLRSRLAIRDSNGIASTDWFTGEEVWVAPGESHTFVVEREVSPGLDLAQFAILGNSTQPLDVGDVFVLHDGVTVEVNSPYPPTPIAPGIPLIDVDQPEDFRVRWLGTPNASESVMEIERVRWSGYVGSCVAGVSTLNGRPAVRLIRTGTADAYVTVSIPEEIRSSPYTLIATSHLTEEVTSIWPGSISYGATPWISFERPKTPGSHAFRIVESADIPSYRLRLASSGTTQADVWWTDIGVYAGNYPYETFNGESDPADTGIAQPEDFRIRWTGAVDNSTSVMEGEVVAGVTGLNAEPIVSSRGGKPAIRLLPRFADIQDSAAQITIPAVARSGGTVLGTVHLTEPLNDTWTSNQTRPLSVRAYNPMQGVQAPNVSGEESLRLSYEALAADFVARWYHGGRKGSGDVWWTDIGLFAGDYDGPVFSGSDGSVTIDGIPYSTRWVGASDFSVSQAGIWTLDDDIILDDRNSVFIPIPEGMQLNIGANSREIGSDSPGIYLKPITDTPSNDIYMVGQASRSNLFPLVIPAKNGIRGVRMWIGKLGDSGNPSFVAVNFIHARLSPIGKPPTGPSHWIGGQGHAGTRFALPPTYISNTGVGGGQISYAATFKESLI